MGKGRGTSSHEHHDDRVRMSKRCQNDTIVRPLLLISLRTKRMLEISFLVDLEAREQIYREILLLQALELRQIKFVLSPIAAKATYEDR